MNYFLKGGEFNNKGAEAMVLVALKNIYSNDPNAQVFIGYTEKSIPFTLRNELKEIYIPFWFVEILLKKCNLAVVKTCIEEFIKYFLSKRKFLLRKIMQSKDLIKKIDFVIDISGFAFSSKWTDDVALYWLDMIKLFQNNGSKIYIMPQSFGPFNFQSRGIIQEAKNVLKKCEIIYAREKEGYRLLKDLELSNVKQSLDSVLLERKIDYSLIIDHYDSYVEPSPIFGEHNFAIIPNYRLVDRGGFDGLKLIEFYSDIINKYKSFYNIYLISHAGEDLKICTQIKEKFINDNKVILVDHVMYSFNFEKFVKNMDFIIASRYHSIIHAYKEYIPAIILGWADKYVELSEEMKQEKYVIDAIDFCKVFNLIENMCKNYETEGEIIKERVLEKQKQQSCYSWLRMLNDN